MAYTEEELKKELETQEYEYGFVTEIEADTFSEGLSEDVSQSNFKKKGRARLDDRMEARMRTGAWKKMEEPEWSNVKYIKPDFQEISYYSAPKVQR